MRGRRLAWLVTVIGLVMIAAVTAACGDDDEDLGGDGDAARAPLSAADVDCTALALTAPERIETAGKFVVASDRSYAPIDFVNEGTNEPIGVDADLARCTAEASGRRRDPERLVRRDHSCAHEQQGRSDHVGDD